MQALIDGDILLYRIGHTTNDVEQGIAKWRLNELFDSILEETKATSFRVFLTDSVNNFRKEIYPLYKANRTQPKPTHYEYLKYLLYTEMDAEAKEGYEADDLLGINQDKVKNDSVICSIDKDLLQIPGNHYNFVNKQWTVITKEEGLFNFYCQLLMGDKTDNIGGIYGIGKKKAAEALKDCKTEDQYFQVCIDLYSNWLQKEWGQWGDFEQRQMYNLLLLYGRLLKIRTKEDELWHFPPSFQQLEPSLDFQSLSIPRLRVETIQSTELTTMEKNG